MTTSYKIPFIMQDGSGSSMMEYTNFKEGEVAVPGQAFMSAYMPNEWRVNEPFDATVLLAGCGRGRSSVRVVVLDPEKNERYSMGIAAFYEACRWFGVWVVKHGALIKGRWEFRKQGQNYTLWPLVDKELSE